MRKNTGSLAAFLFLLACALSSHAQPPTDSLNGKTIHIYVESDNFNAFFVQNGDIALKVDSKYNYSITLAGRDLFRPLYIVHRKKKRFARAAAAFLDLLQEQPVNSEPALVLH